jgi:hypothetical protein
MSSLEDLIGLEVGISSGVFGSYLHPDDSGEKVSLQASLHKWVIAGGDGAFSIKSKTGTYLSAEGGKVLLKADCGATEKWVIRPDDAKSDAKEAGERFWITSTDGGLYAETAEQVSLKTGEEPGGRWSITLAEDVTKISHIVFDLSKAVVTRQAAETVDNAVIYNNANQPQSFEEELDYSYCRTSHFTQEFGPKIGPNISFESVLPGISVEAPVLTTFSGTWTMSKPESKDQEIKMAINPQVSPLKMMMATLSLTKAQLEVPWTAQAHFASSATKEVKGKWRGVTAFDVVVSFKEEDIEAA